MCSLHYHFRLGKSTIFYIIYETATAICKCLKDKYLKTPETPVEWYKIAERFDELWQYPHCVGALDGKHITVFAPPNSGSYFFNYKDQFSIILLALVDADLKVTYVDVGTNGRVHDSTVLMMSTLGQRIENSSLGLPPPEPLRGRNRCVPYVIVADQGFSMKPNIMRPYGRGQLNNERSVYNYRHSRSRRTSENFFGLLCHRFRIFLKPIQALPNHVEMLVLSTCILHNLLRSEAVGITSNICEDENVCAPLGLETMLPLPHQGFRASAQATSIRDEFCAYFNNEGAVHWQDKFI